MPSRWIGRDYLAKLEALGLPAQEHPGTVLHIHGDGERASPKFNVQVYQDRRGRLTLVTNDEQTLRRLLRGVGMPSEEGKRIILMDDAGWGFPLGGVICGAHDSETGQFYWREIEVEHFQDANFLLKTYLGRYTERALEIVHEINPDFKQTIVKICTGYVNTSAKDALRERLTVVEVDEIGEPLQSWLETRTGEYVKGLAGADIYYDPKQLPKNEIGRRYYAVVNFAKFHGLLDVCKTGWRNFPR